MLVFLFSILSALIRGTILNSVDADPFYSLIGLIIPDVIFFGSCVYWLFKKKIKFNAYLVLFLLAYLGSIFWDYQNGYIAMKVAFPFVLFTIVNKDKFKLTNLKKIIEFFIPIIVFPPYLLFKIFYRKGKTAISQIGQENENKILSNSKNYFKPVMLGLGVGLVIFLILAGLDAEFAKFLNIEEIWDLIGRMLVSLIYYNFAFFVFFWLPVNAEYDAKELPPMLVKLINSVVMAIVAIVVGYTVYDIYIGLRAFKLVDFKFESMGKNTQMQYLEMVFLNGFWLFFIAYVLGGMQGFWQENKKRVEKFSTVLLVSMLWLLPSLLNIVRVLLNVYIPEFGLTSKRLFGLYTLIAFVITMVMIVRNYGRKEKNIFINSFLDFALALSILGFVMPNSLIIANWHFDKYLTGKEIEIKNDPSNTEYNSYSSSRLSEDGYVDFRYLTDMKLNKWGFLMENKLESEKYPSDNVLGLAWSKQRRNKKAYENYVNNIMVRINPEVSLAVNTMVDKDFGKISDTFGNGKIWYYDGEMKRDMSLAFTGGSTDKKLGEIRTMLEGEFDESWNYREYIRLPFEVKYKYLNINSRNANESISELDVDAPTEIDRVMIETEKKQYEDLVLNLSDSRSSKKMLELNENFTPFLLSDSWVSECMENVKKGDGAYTYGNDEICQTKTKTEEWHYPLIPESMVKAYWNDTKGNK